MSFAILGIGTALPATTVSQAEGMLVARRVCCTTVEQAVWLPQIYRQSGIHKRHFVMDRQIIRDLLEGTRLSGSPFLRGENKGGPTTGQRMEHYARHAGPLALEAAGLALRQACVPAREVTHLVTISCTGFQAPGVDLTLIGELGLPPTTQRTHVGFMGCHGALNGLRVARALTTSEADARVLLCAVELCSLHYQYEWEPETVVANALFADGAAAVVGAAEAPGRPWKLRASGSCVFAGSADAMTWTIGDHGFVMTLSRQVPELIASNLRPWLVPWLQQRGLDIGQIASWAVHPGGPKILSAVQETLGLPGQALQPAWEVFSSHGNMSSPTVLFLLDHLRQQDAPRPCLALGFGPGLTVEAALFE